MTKGAKPGSNTTAFGSTQASGEPVLTGVDVPLRHGTEVGEYVIEAEIGKGAFGSVYRAIHPLIGKQAAIKVLNARCSVDRHVVSRFLSEARAVNQIQHEHIIDIFSFGQLPDGRHYHIMEYLEGSALDAYLAAQGRLSLEESLAILGPIGEALDAAHKKEIAHRDLKPANIFLAKRSDGAWYPKLLDFGIAKLLSDDLPKDHQTQTGAAVGTPHYMSPEQCQGADVDHRTDIYAFGVMAYRMLTGKVPFEAPSTVEVLMAHMTRPPPPPSETCPEIPPQVEGALFAMLAKDRDQRPNTLREAVNMMRTGAGLPPATITGGGAIRTTSTPAPFGATLEREEVLVPRKGNVSPALVAALILGALAIAVAGGFWSRSQRAAPAPPAAAMPVPPPPVIQAAPPVKKTIEVTVAGAPEGATVQVAGGDALGVAPGPFELPRADENVELVIEAPGYERKVQTIRLSADTVVQVEMRPVPKKKKRRRKRRPRPENMKRKADTIPEF